MGYAVPSVPGDHRMCCWSGGGSNGACCEGCRLEPGGPSGVTMAPAINGPIPLEGSRLFFVLYRVENAQVDKIRIFSEDCPLDAGGLTLHWLTGVRPADSVAVLASYVGASSTNRLADSALSALAMHQEPAALDRLIASAREGATTKIRGQSLFWLAQRAGEKAVGAISEAIARDPETEVKKRAVFAMSQLPKDEGVPLLIQLARTNSQPRRPQAGDVLARPVEGPARAALLRGDPVQVRGDRPCHPGDSPCHRGTVPVTGDCPRRYILDIGAGAPLAAMSIESSADRKALERVSRIVAETLDVLEHAVRPGISTAELDGIAAALFRRRGARSAPAIVYGFPGTVLISVNDEIVHGVPGSRRLRRGDLVKLDVTVEKDGYVADAARSLAVESSGETSKRLIACATAAFEAGLGVARPGILVNEIGRAVETEVRRWGFFVVRGLSGHGVGRTIHEEPSVPNEYDPRQRDVLTEGLVLTIEPMVSAGTRRRGAGPQRLDDQDQRRQPRVTSRAHHRHHARCAAGPDRPATRGLIRRLPNPHRFLTRRSGRRAGTRLSFAGSTHIANRQSKERSLVSTLPERPREISVPTSAGISVRDVRLRSGVRLGYAERGPRLGPVMLMLHGYTDSWFSFSRVLPLLPKDVRVVALDQRGHGDSDRPANGYSIDHLAADAVQAMDALNIPSATLVGHSMGSFVARRIAERAPTRVSRLVLVGSACTARTPAVAELAQAVSALTDPIDEGFVRAFQQSTIYRPVPTGFLRRVVEDSRRVPARVWQAALTGLLDYTPSRMAIQCPAVVLGGEQDGVFSAAEQRELVRVMPNAEFHIDSGIGHALHWEDPERFVALVR